MNLAATRFPNMPQCGLSQTPVVGASCSAPPSGRARLPPSRLQKHRSPMHGSAEGNSFKRLERRMIPEGKFGRARLPPSRLQENRTLVHGSAGASPSRRQCAGNANAVSPQGPMERNSSIDVVNRLSRSTKCGRARLPPSRLQKNRTLVHGSAGASPSRRRCRESLMPAGGKLSRTPLSAG